MGILVLYGPLLESRFLILSKYLIKYSHFNFFWCQCHMSPSHPNDRKLSQTKIGLIITVLLGIYFTILQGLEYFEARFTFADRVYGSTFFIATGFHGLHVIVGTLFLLVILIRHINFEFRERHHFGFEAAA